MANSQEKMASNTEDMSEKAVAIELQKAEERASQASKTIGIIRGEILEIAKKEDVTDQDVETMKQKQTQLMEKISEFEDITKTVQRLVGESVEDVTKMLLQKKPSLPMVIVCGPGFSETVPKIIICEKNKSDKAQQEAFKQYTGAPGQELYSQRPNENIQQ